MPVEISILAGGWSAAQFDFDQLPGHVIGVNEGALVPGVYNGITMDRLWMEANHDRIKDPRVTFWARRSAVQNLHIELKLGKESDVAKPTIIIFENDHTSTEMVIRPGRLNGTSSGMCALNLAFQLLALYRHDKPRTVYLFGFDCNRSPDGRAYWHDPYPWALKGATSSGKYRQWASEYVDVARQFAAAGIQVFNMSATSSITAFPRGPIERVAKR